MNRSSGERGLLNAPSDSLWNPELFGAGQSCFDRLPAACETDIHAAVERGSAAAGSRQHATPAFIADVTCIRHPDG